MKKISTLFWFAALSAGTFSLQAAYSGVGTFNKIASASEITTGSYVFMANDQAMSNDFNKRFTAVALTYADDTKTSITDPDAYTRKRRRLGYTGPRAQPGGTE